MYTNYLQFKTLIYRDFQLRKNIEHLKQKSVQIKWSIDT